VVLQIFSTREIKAKYLDNQHYCKERQVLILNFIHNQNISILFDSKVDVICIILVL
jgi:hypothetical protein